MPLTQKQKDEQLKDRRDYRRSLICRRNASESRMRQLEIDEKIAIVEDQIRELTS